MTDWKYHFPEFKGDYPPDWDGGPVTYQCGMKWLKATPDWCKHFKYRYKAKKIEPEPAPRCKNCKFFDKGECKRYPPSIGPSGWKILPRVDYHDWCGEFVNKPC